MRLYHWTLNENAERLRAEGLPPSGHRYCFCTHPDAHGTWRSQTRFELDVPFDETLRLTGVECSMSMVYPEASDFAISYEVANRYLRPSTPL